MSKENINQDEIADAMITPSPNVLIVSSKQDDEISTTDTTTTTTTDPSEPIKPEIIIEKNMNQLFCTLQPFIMKLDEQVMSVRLSQQQLNDELSRLLSILDQIKQYPNNSTNVNNDDDDDADNQLDTTKQDDISATQQQQQQQAVFIYPKRMFTTTSTGGHNCDDDLAIDIEEKSRRLLGLKRRLTLIHSILQTVNSRVKKLLLAHDSRVLRQLQTSSTTTSN